MSAVSRRTFLSTASAAAVVPVVAAGATSAAVPPVKKDFNVSVKTLKELKLDDNQVVPMGQYKKTQVDCDDIPAERRVKFKPPFGKREMGNPKDRPTITFPGTVAGLTRVDVEVDVAEIALVGGGSVKFLKVKINPVTGVTGGGETSTTAFSDCCLMCDNVIYCGTDICVECYDGLAICCPIGP